MAIGVSYRIAPGVRYYSNSSGSVALVLVLAAIYAFVWSLLAAVALAVLATTVLLLVGAAIWAYRVRTRRIEELVARSVAPGAVTVVGRGTEPPTFGVYCVEGFAGGTRGLQYRVGRHPVRQAELVREFGAAVRLGLFTGRADAEEFRHLLASGRLSPARFFKSKGDMPSSTRPG